MATTEAARIVRELHDEPHIQGRRITVLDVRDLVEERGLSAVDVADRFDLTVADVYRALTYYYEHQEGMSQVERQREGAKERSRECGAWTSAEVIVERSDSDGE